MVAGEILTFTATGSQTSEGESKNTYSVAWGSANEKNYTLTDELGTLLVSVNHTTPGGDDPEKPITIAITITADSANKAYDGTPLTATGSSATGLPEGYMYSATCSGSQITAGTGSNTITSYKIFDASDKDVTEFLTNVTIVDGALTVTPANLTVVTSSASKVYDGTPLTCSTATISGLANGETASVTATGTITDVGVVKNTYTINWGTFDAANYTVSENLGTLTIEKLQLSIQWSQESAIPYACTTWTAGSSGSSIILTYQNGPHKGETVTGQYAELSSATDPTAVAYEFTLFTGDKVMANLSGGGMNVGTYDIDISAEISSGKAANYSIECTAGSLVVAPIKLHVVTDSADKFYDGQPLTAGLSVYQITENGSYQLTLTEGKLELVADEIIEFSTTGTITEVGEEDNTYSIEWFGVNKNNYTITDEIGKLTIKAKPYTITAGSDSKPFAHTAGQSHSPLTCSTFSVQGFPSGWSVQANTSGSQLLIGSSANTIESFTIYDASNNDVTEENKDKVKLVDGTLEITAPQNTTYETYGITQLITSGSGEGYIIFGGTKETYFIKTYMRQ